MAAQAAVAAVRKGCELLSEGRAEIDKFKKNIEKGVNDAKAIYKEVTGIWGWLTGLFGAKKESRSQAVAAPVESQPKQAEPKRNSKPEPRVELSYEEYQTQAIHQVCEQLKTFFEIRRTLRAHCLELEEIAKTTDTIEDSAIDRVEIEMQLENMTTQIREAMVYAPKELKDIYSRFLRMYELILEEQEFARQVKIKKERDAKWQREQIHHSRVYRVRVTVVALLLTIWLWAFLIATYWQRKMPIGF
jgi:hypothetical protein